MYNSFQIPLQATVLLFAISIFFACNSNTESSSEKLTGTLEPKNVVSKNLNISLFIDLSDRIDIDKHPNQTMHYYKRDLGYINSITSCFEKHLLNKRIVLINDQMQVYIDPAPSSNEVNSLLSNMKISFTKYNADRKKIESINDLYLTSCESIYNKTIRDKNFIGSDIWGFFKNKVKDYCISDNHRNILIIFTDGYMFHINNRNRIENKSTYLSESYIVENRLNRPDWENRILQNKYGFIPARNDLEELEVMIIGINSYRNTTFEDIIFKYWSNWLTEMNVKKFKIVNADLPVNVDKIISDFILPAQ